MTIKSRTSLHSVCRLVFFSFVLILACRQEPASTSISILWKDDRATALSIPKKVPGNISEDSLSSQLQVKLAGATEQTPIAGDYHSEADAYIFEPQIPFTRGLHYNVWYKHTLLAEIEIPKSKEVPQLLAIYPSTDTLPENLLKIYLQFSRPMQEGNSSQYITLKDQQGNVLPHSFLQLQSELWNEDRTILTLWLDPGRIKRDLQPNKSEGAPLIKDNVYHLNIAAEWPDQHGNPLTQSYSKNIIAIDRDTVSPSPERWTLRIPTKGSQQPFIIEPGEALDYILLLNAISITDAGDNKITGSIRIDQQERIYSFTPDKPWPSGAYKLRIEARLCDLAGNNLNRLFDVDLGNTEAKKPGKEIYERVWRIE